MNDKTEDEPETDAATETDAPAEDSADSTEVVAAAAPQPEESQAEEAPATREKAAAAKKSSSGLGFLALLVALAAAAGSGYVWYEQQAQKALALRVDAISLDLGKRAADLDRALDAVEDLARIDGEIADDVAVLSTRVDDELDALPARLARLESTVEKVPGISQKARSAWLRSEAEYFLRVANAQLNLAGNVGVSLRALELADEQLRDLADPALTPVREAISDEQAALKAVPQPDAEGIVLRLGSLSRSLNSLTFSNAAPGSYRAPETEATDDTGWQRAWKSIVDALTSIISVKRDDQEIAPLLTAAEEAMLIRSLDVDLQVARLAVIRNEGDLYRRSLDAVRDRLKQYFDTSSPGVTAALATIDELSRAELPEEFPDISGSLTLLRASPGGALAQ